MSAAAITIEFEVEPDESGGYVASAQAGTHSLVTEGETLDELRVMIEDLLLLFTENSGMPVESYTLRLHPAPVAA